VGPRTAQVGDRVWVHYVKRFQDGSETSSRGQAPLELTVGRRHPRLPGLGLALVGLAAGASTNVTVPAERAYRPRNPNRVRRLDRRCFRPDRALAVGQSVRILGRGGRHWVRIVAVSDQEVVVDTNHPKAGQAMELAVALIAVQAPV
jgi:peptidylprolyl isomerase